jgi:hypothetical protein
MKLRQLEVGTPACAGNRLHERKIRRPCQRLPAAPFCFRETIGCNTRDSFMCRKISIKKLAEKQKMVYVESV